MDDIPALIERLESFADVLNGDLQRREAAAALRVLMARVACVPAVPADVAGLVERLSSFLAGSNGARRTLNEAIETLQAQAAEIERLREIAKSYKGDAIDTLAKLREAVEVMRAINKRASPDPTRTFDDAIRDLEHVTTYARAFLATMEKTDG